MTIELTPQQREEFEKWFVSNVSEPTREDWDFAEAAYQAAVTAEREKWTKLIHGPTGVVLDLAEIVKKAVEAERERLLAPSPCGVAGHRECDWTDNSVNSMFLRGHQIAQVCMPPAAATQNERGREMRYHCDHDGCDICGVHEELGIKLRYFSGYIICESCMHRAVRFTYEAAATFGGTIIDPAKVCPRAAKRAT